MFNHVNYFVFFERKKFKIETLGEYLAEVRNSLNFSLEEISKQTGINLKFLIALENGRFEVLPPDVYVLGFLRQLAEIYKINAQTLIEQYKKEKIIDNNLKIQALSPKSKVESFWERLVITPKNLSVFLGALFIAASIGYIVWQVLSINRAPSLTILEPQNNVVISGSFAVVRGKTKPGALVKINQQELFVESDGSFETELGVSPGPRELIITASNRFGKSTSQALTVIGQEKADKNFGLVLKLEILEPVSVSYTIDDGDMLEPNFQTGDVKFLEAQRKIILSTPNAGAVKVSVNGKDIGVMGREGENLSNIPFFAESDTMEDSNK